MRRIGSGRFRRWRFYGRFGFNSFILIPKGNCIYGRIRENRLLGSRFALRDEIEARFSRKRSSSWVGYKVHLTEICARSSPHLITNVETTSATTADCTLTQPIHQVLKEKDLVPKEHIVDTAYIDAPELVNSKQTHDIELIGPVLPDSSWQALSPDGLDLTQFEINWDEQSARCPQGHLSKSA